MISEQCWVRVTRREPCRICGKPDWCTVSADGAVACCMRVQSDWRMANGGSGHTLVERPPTPFNWRERVRRQERASSPRPARPDFEAMWQQMRLVDTNSRLCALAGRLGVSRHSLDRLGAAWADRARAWAFPMRVPDGRIVGIRLRSDDGRKWAVRGSRAALFLAAGGIGELVTQIVIAEGPTDMAALLDLGYEAVGRPSCRGSHDLVAPLATGRDVVIVSDVDTPGRMGARDLARAIRRAARSVRIIEPLVGKDLRAWRQAGATREVVDVVIQQAGFWHGG